MTMPRCCMQRGDRPAPVCGEAATEIAARIAELRGPPARHGRQAGADWDRRSKIANWTIDLGVWGCKT